MTCQHRTGWVGPGTALRGAMNELHCRECGREIRLTAHSERVLSLLYIAAGLLGLGAGCVAMCCIPTDVPILIFGLVGLPAAFLFAGCAMEVYLRFFARFEELPAEAAPDEAAEACRHAPDRLVLGGILLRRDAEFICRGCGRRIRLTRASRRRQWALDVATYLLVVAAVILLAFARTERAALAEQAALAFCAVVALSLGMGAVRAIYIKHLARFELASAGRSLTGIDLRSPGDRGRASSD